MDTLQEKVVLITGAAGGFGRAIAKGFAARGSHLALLDINAAGLEELAGALGATGATVHTAVADLSTERGVREGIAFHG